jgi:hypothetical protein
MSDDVSIAEASDSMLLRMFKEDPRYEEILKIGRDYNLNFADLVRGLKTPGGCSLLFALNYGPDRNDTLQPSIAKLMRIARIILVGSFGYTKEAAEQYLKSETDVANRSPFKFGYTFINANKKNKAWYKKIQDKTDPIMKEMYEQILPKLPKLKAVVAFGGESFAFFSGIDCITPYLAQTVPCPHPQVPYNNQATSEQRDAFIGILTDALSLATGVNPSRPLLLEERDDAIVVSAVPTAERIAKGVETRALNQIRDRIAKAGMKEEILSLAPSDDEVREEIDLMSLRELSLWIHHNGKRLEKAAKAAKAAAAAAEKQARAQHKAEKAAAAAAEKQARAQHKAEKAAAAAAEKQAREQHKAEEAAAAAATITRVKARTLWTRFFNGVRKLNTIAVILEFKPKRKRKKSS